MAQQKWIKPKIKAQPESPTEPDPTSVMVGSVSTRQLFRSGSGVISATRSNVGSGLTRPEPDQTRPMDSPN